MGHDGPDLHEVCSLTPRSPMVDLATAISDDSSVNNAEQSVNSTPAAEPSRWRACASPRRTGLPRVRSDRAFRAASDRRANKGRDRRRSGPRQAARAPPSRSREDRRRAGVGESRPIANRGRQAARLGALDRLSRSRSRRYRTVACWGESMGGRGR